MYKTKSFGCAKMLAAKHGLKTGFSAIDGQHYVGTPQELAGCGCPGFRLEPQPATLKPRATFTSTKAAQKPLFSGLDCLPGQTDLFPTDGSL